MTPKITSLTCASQGGNFKAGQVQNYLLTGSEEQKVILDLPNLKITCLTCASQRGNFGRWQVRNYLLSQLFVSGIRPSTHRVGRVDRTASRALQHFLSFLKMDGLGGPWDFLDVTRGSWLSVYWIRIHQAYDAEEGGWGNAMLQWNQPIYDEYGQHAGCLQLDIRK